MKTMTLFLLLMSAVGATSAQAPISADGQVPPALRSRPTEAPVTGAALRAQALGKLEAQFRTADADGNGSLTLAEAQGFGFVARHFDDIDTGRRGAVTFADLRAYLARIKADRR